MSKGYYSLIQWCADFARAEAANVGVLVYRPEPPATVIKVADDVGHVRRRFGLREADLRDVVEAVRAIGYRVANMNFRSVAELEQFVRSRGNQIQMTPPRPMWVDDPPLETKRLFDELVTPVPARVRRSALRRPRAERGSSKASAGTSVEAPRSPGPSRDASS